MDVQTLIEICQFIYKLLNINKNSMLIKNHNYVENKRKMRCNSPNLDLININVYICTKFYQTYKNIEEKHIFYIKQRP